MRKKKLFILSPSDRFNYGDMLFPFILKYYLGDLVDEIVNCSSTCSDYSEKGALPTFAYDVLYKVDDEDDNYLVIAGGESLFVTWPVILSFIHKNVEERVDTLKRLPHIPFLHRIYYAYLTHHIKKAYKLATQYPFTPGLYELPGFKSVMYNSVGSACLSERKEIIKSNTCKRILNSSAYISVRDKGTCNALQTMGVKFSLYPDSAILMSEVFSNSFLDANKTVSDTFSKENNYIFFQINKSISEGKENTIGKIISNVIRRTKRKFVLCPIGTALGHYDDIALESISRFIPKDSYFKIENPNLWDIMYLIKNSCLYIGTSLHGAITAMSYSVPIVTHGKKKVEQYINDWGGVFTTLDSLEEVIIKQLTRPIISSPLDQKKLALQSMNNMRAIIEDNSH